MELFQIERDTRVVFEKVAAQFKLSDNPATLESELQAQLYKQHPYLGTYSIQLQIENQEQNLGYLYGMFMVKAATDIPAPNTAAQASSIHPQSEQPEPEDPSKAVRIPVIVQENKAHGFDVFIDPNGQFWPLSEQRLAAQMFDASPFAVAPASALKTNQMQTTQGFTGGKPEGAMGGGSRLGQVKQSSPSSLLDRVTISSAAGTDVLLKMAGTEGFRSELTRSPALSLAVGRIIENMQPAEMAMEVALDDGPVLLEKTDGGYRAKTASVSRDLTNAEGSRLSPALRQQVMSQGFTVVGGASEPLPVVGHVGKTKLAFVNGTYSAMREGIPELETVQVFRNVLRLDGNPSSNVLVVGGDTASMQEKVAGVLEGPVTLEDMNFIPAQEAKGAGVFFFQKLAAISEPVSVSSYTVEGRPRYTVEHPFHGAVEAVFTKVASPILRDGALFLPEDTYFCNKRPAHDAFVSDERVTDAHQSAGRMDKLASIEVDGSDYILRGAVEGRSNLQGTVWALVREGDSLAGALEKCAASHADPVQFYLPTQLTGAETAQPEALEHRGVYLLKEAAALAQEADQDTVDSVLSLSFLTPENTQSFLEALPDLETCVTKLAELLIAVRLGLKDVPEAAVSSALRGLDRTIDGLKAMQSRSTMR
jgi:hypothetical protein